MRKKLVIYLGSILLLFAIGGMVVVWNLRSLTYNQDMVKSGMDIHHDYLSAISNLQTAQTELYRHQAGYESDISALASSVDSLDYYVSSFMERVSDASRKEALKEVSALLNDYKRMVSLLLTYEDREERVRLEKEAAELGGNIRDKLMNLYAISEAETIKLIPVASRIIMLSQLVIYLTLIFSGILSVTASFLLVRGITDSVGGLIKGTDAISSGDYTKRVEVTSKDELGVLSERFNLMAEAVSKRDEEIQSTLEELQASYSQMQEMTQELETAKSELELEHRRLIEARDYLQNVLEDSPDVIITTDTEGNVVEFNRGAEEMLGYGRKDVIGRPAEHLYHEKIERQKILRIIEEKGRVTNYETRLETRDGRALDVSLTLSQLRDGLGNVIGTVGISRDITEIKRRREELISLNKKLQETTLALEAARADLERKVEERTRELKEANEMLIESNIRIKEADRLKSEFMANMSHELRTPLNAIIGFSELLLDGIDGEINDVQRVDLTHIHGSGQHLLAIINDILDLSKIEAGRMELVKEEVDLASIIQGVVSVSKTLIKGKDVKLKVRTDEALPVITADGKRVKQIILNLMSNAAKFTEEGEIEIRAVPEGEGQILVSVRDTGIGIKEEDIPKVFEKFRQIDMSSTRNKGGTGLGIAITKRLVEMHGGSIWLESEFGKGTTFFVKLPVSGKEHSA
jgi:PAS domain S-box-containing protein